MDLGIQLPRFCSLSPFLIPFVKPTHGGDAHECDEETNQT
jgi:hypothetical protein